MPVAYSTSIIARSRRPRGVDDVRLRDQRVDFLERQELRQRRPGARRAQIVGRVALEVADRAQEPVEAAHRGDRRAPPSAATARAHLLAHELPRARAIQRLERSACASAKPASPRRSRA